MESRIGLFTAGYLTPTVPLISATTPGTVLGGPVEWILTIGSLLGLAVASWLARRRRKADVVGPESGPVEVRVSSGGSDA